MRRLADRAIAFAVLAVAAPVLLACAAVLRIASPGPVLYRARRAGRGGREFTMFKLRTMRIDAHADGRITRHDDHRVHSRFGAWLRRLKLDELPQLWNVVRGDMAIVGPRPEDPDIVRRCYTEEHQALLRVLPGLASPGALYASSHGDRLLSGADAERQYIERVLPITTALDLFYVRHASLVYDIRVVARTVWFIITVACGRRFFPDPPELREACRAGVAPAASTAFHRGSGIPARRGAGAP